MLSRLLLGVCLAALVLSASAQMMRRRMPIYVEEDEDQFDAQGLEVLEGRYGTAYPGYAGLGTNVNPNVNLGLSGMQQQASWMQQQNVMQEPINLGNVGVNTWQQQNLPLQYSNIPQQPILSLEQQAQQPFVSLAQIPQVQSMQQPINLGFQQTFSQQPIAQFSGVNVQNIPQVQNIQTQIPQSFGATMIPQQQDFSQELLLTQQNIRANSGMLQSQLAPQSFGASTVATPLATTVMPSYGLSMPTNTLGAVGAMGSYGGIGALGSGGSQLGTSKKTTTAQPIYAQSMVVPKIITQPILRPHSVTQPIVQQQLIQQPIVETRQVIQPVIRRIITQPIIRPEIYESTTVQPMLKQETTVQPHIVQQTVVTPQLQNQYEEQAPITEAPKTTKTAPVVQPTISAKKQSGGLGGMMSNLF